MGNKICYVERRFSESSLAIIHHANQIIDEYVELGFQLTLRQLYYQFVSRALIENTVRSYKRLGSIVNDARLAGLISWDAIEDRTRNLKALSHWGAPHEIVESAARQYRIDKWASQPCRVEVWIEKEALAGVFQGVCERLDVPFFCCRGYTSQSEMWAAARRLIEVSEAWGQEPIILHFGDHDPSGIDMSRDIQDRLKIFNAWLRFERLALNMDQIEHYTPPPNPAKESDSRFSGYIEKFGHESYELDALDPPVLEELVDSKIDELLDRKAWRQAVQREEAERSQLVSIASNWQKISKYVRDLGQSNE